MNPYKNWVNEFSRLLQDGRHFHLSLPAWMMDNVRRGGELVGGQGGAAPDFAFATLYRLRRWRQGQAVRFYEGGKQVPAAVNLGELFA